MPWFPKSRRRAVVTGGLLCVLLPLAAAAMDSRMSVVYYTVESDKLTTRVRLALITDFHGCSYGPGQSQLLLPLEECRPDLILLGGDIFDDVLPWEHSLELLSALAEEYPCYYTTGNHEYRSGRVQAVKTLLTAQGVTVLDGACVVHTVNGQSLSLSGVDDPAAGEAYKGQLDAAAPWDCATCSVLLAHRPERVEEYLPYGYDVILSGHAHGGQWRIPGLINGLIAPNAGLFPPYAGGRYVHESTVHIVSRGLARETTIVPRIFNRPELVMVDLVPVGEGAEHGWYGTGLEQYR